MPRARVSPHWLRELRFIGPGLACAGAVQAAVFWQIGWSEIHLVLASATWMVVVASGLVATRGCSYYLFYHPTIESKLTRKIALIGNDVHATRIAERFDTSADYGLSIAGIFADDPGVPGDVSLAGSIADLIALSKALQIDAIIIALPPGRSQEAKIGSLVWRLRSVPVDMFVVPYLISRPDLPLPVQLIGPMYFTVLQRRPLSSSQFLRKKCLDYAICAIIIIPISFVCLLTAIAIKLDSPGPVLFRQPRRGFNDRQFTVFKFRTMYTNQTDLLAARQTSRDDPRVTRVGKWLRRLASTNCRK